MSLPRIVRWDYSRYFDPQSAEAELVENYPKSRKIGCKTTTDRRKC